MELSAHAKVPPPETLTLLGLDCSLEVESQTTYKVREANTNTCFFSPWALSLE